MRATWLTISSIVIGVLALSATPARAALSASLTIDPVATRTTDRLVVIVTGSYTCGPVPQPQPNEGSNFADIFVSVEQASGRSIAQGENGVFAVCDGNPQTFEISIHSENIPWHGGQARAIGALFVQQCDEFFNCESARSDVDVQIKLQGGK
ncbi:MAG TPA: hypothetical protein VGL11_16895 [Candidatus Binatia bacterium]|jgi:hypothetical protein